jgi:hypothetical protein
MAEIREVKSKQLDQRCPLCQNGWMRPTGLMVTGTPPMHQHKCTLCSHEQSYPVRYPYIVQE